jgi:hypothetical protein
MLLGALEEKIKQAEGFGVRFVRMHSRKGVKRTTRDVGNYTFQKKAKDSMSVAEFKELRLGSYRQQDWDAEILLGDGSAAHGRTLLETVRKSYEA